MGVSFKDKEFGEISVRRSMRAKRYSLKVVNGQIIATLPVGGNIDGMKEVIIRNREWIRKALLKSPEKPLFDEQTDLQTATVKIKIVRKSCVNYQIVTKSAKELEIVCPLDTDFHSETIQEFLKEVIVGILRREAKRYLPPRLMLFAEKYGFEVNEVKINRSKTHWGSCTSMKNINLSLNNMLLPWHLIDYILLHELCHTREMNHGDRFWSLMNKVTDGKALALREELKKYHML